MRSAMARRMPRSLGGTGLRQTSGGALHVGARDGPVGSGGLDDVEVDVELARQRPHRGKDLQRPHRRRGRPRPRGFFSARSSSPTTVPVSSPRLRQTRPEGSHLHQIALGAEQARDAAALWRWHPTTALSVSTDTSG